MSRIEYNPSLNDKVAGQLGDLGVEIQIPLSSIKDLIMPYKVYTALLSQAGLSEPLVLFDGELTIGVTYLIDDNGGSGWDFTNVGAPNNDLFTYFVATGTTPNSWGSDAMLSYNLGAPVVTVLQNTIGNIWFTYENVGNYNIQSNTLFTVNKTYCSATLSNHNNDATNAILGPVNNSSLRLITLLPTDGPFNSSDTSIEIRVYN